ncbi:hypothetical protein Bbelb_209350 [Branchiostoma belcheri]|nr:hypothetical protein Bbelb_209350 [Branchiostoma belcheri]
MSNNMEEGTPRTKRRVSLQKEWGRLRTFLGGSTRLAARQPHRHKDGGFTKVEMEGLQVSEIDGECQEDPETGDCMGKSCRLFEVGYIHVKRNAVTNDIHCTVECATCLKNMGGDT